MTARRPLLFCLPYAGGDGRIYRAWPAALEPWVDVLVADLPGRGRRYATPAFRAIQPAVDHLLDALMAAAPQRVVLFGHSMGALLAFELARAIERLRPAMLAHLFVSALRAPRLPARDRPIHSLAHDEFIAALRELNGTPAELLAHRELMDFLAPMIRADFELCETYRYAAAPPLAAGITACSGSDDSHHAPGDMAGWRDETNGPFEAVTVVGDHFYIHAASAELLRHVSRTLARLPGVGGTPLG